jgi:hypothetical protein
VDAIVEELVDEAELAYPRRAVEGDLSILRALVLASFSSQCALRDPPAKLEASSQP